MIRKKVYQFLKLFYGWIVFLRFILNMKGFLLDLTFLEKKGLRISSEPLILLWRERRDSNSRPSRQFWRDVLISSSMYSRLFLFFISFSRLIALLLSEYSSWYIISQGLLPFVYFDLPVLWRSNLDFISCVEPI